MKLLGMNIRAGKG